MTGRSTAGEPGVLRGQFYTDGETFAFQLDGTPIGGVGASPQAAFDDLMRAQGVAGDLSEKLQLLARDQAGERVRASLIHVFGALLIALTLVGGVVAGVASVAPQVLADIDRISRLATEGADAGVSEAPQAAEPGGAP